MKGQYETDRSDSFPWDRLLGRAAFWNDVGFLKFSAQ